MRRSTINIAGLFVIGLVLFVVALVFAFFASPEAVRSTPPGVYNSLLLEMLRDQ